MEKYRVNTEWLDWCENIVFGSIIYQADSGACFDDYSKCILTGKEFNSIIKHHPDWLVKVNQSEFSRNDIKDFFKKAFVPNFTDALMDSFDKWIKDSR